MTHHAVPITRVSDSVTQAATTGVRRYPKGHPKGGKFVPKGEVLAVTATQTVTAAPAREEIIAYKGFNKNPKTNQLSCRSHVFEVGKTYEHPSTPAACRIGYHACVNPFHMFGFYAPRWDHIFGKVKLLGPFDKESDKVAAKGIEILEEFSWPHLLNTLVKFTKENPEDWVIKARVSLNNPKDNTKQYDLRTLDGNDAPQISTYGNVMHMSSAPGQLQVDNTGIPQMAFGQGSKQFGKGNWQVSHGDNILTTQYGGGRVEVYGQNSRVVVLDHNAFVRGVAGTKVSYILGNEAEPFTAVIGEGNLTPMAWLTLKDITPVVPRQYGLGVV